MIRSQVGLGEVGDADVRHQPSRCRSTSACQASTSGPRSGSASGSGAGPAWPGRAARGTRAWTGSRRRSRDGDPGSCCTPYLVRGSPSGGASPTSRSSRSSRPCRAAGSPPRARTSSRPSPPLRAATRCPSRSRAAPRHRSAGTIGTSLMPPNLTIGLSCTIWYMDIERVPPPPPHPSRCGPSCPTSIPRAEVLPTVDGRERTAMPQPTLSGPRTTWTSRSCAGAVGGDRVEAGDGVHLDVVHAGSSHDRHA